MIVPKRTESYLLGIPRPRPLIARCAAPGGSPRCGACGCSDCSFSVDGLARCHCDVQLCQHGRFAHEYLLIVSSTLRIRHAASTAACIALTFTKAGSHTKASRLSLTPSLSKSTPAQIFPFRCSTLNRVRIFVASKPAFSQSCLGIISRALANDLMMACCFRGML